MVETVREKLLDRLTLKFVDNWWLWSDVAKVVNSTIADFVNCDGDW